MQTLAVVCHVTIMMKVEFDGRDLLTDKDREAYFAALEGTTVIGGELKKAKAKMETLNTDLLKAQKEASHNMGRLKRAHAMVKGLEREKVDLENQFVKLGCAIAAYKAEIKKRKAKLGDSEFLETTFRAHQDFDSFAKDFNDAGSKFLWNESKRFHQSSTMVL